MEQNDQRNFIVAMVLMVGFLFAYQFFVIDPQQRRDQAAREAAAAAQAAAQPAPAPATAAPTPALPDATATTATPAATPTDTPATATPASDTRIRFDAGALDGSIRLSGSRLDDVRLKRHHVTVERETEVRLLSPEDETLAYFALIGWVDGTGKVLAGDNAAWRLLRGEMLTPNTPVVLELQDGDVRITRTISVDDNYMFTFADTVENTGAADLVVRPVSTVRRYGAWKSFVEAIDISFQQATGIVHMGLIGVTDRRLTHHKYQEWQKGKMKSAAAVEAGWWGMTDRYWLTAIIPERGQAFQAGTTSRTRDGRFLIEAVVTGGEVTLSPGANLSRTHRIYAGAKELDILKDYEKRLGVPRFEEAIDWGNFYFLTKPFFWLLKTFQSWIAGVGVVSFGLAILMLTVAVKAVFFPIQTKAYESMSKMKKLTEPMKEIRERFAADKQRQQQEIMKLYQREKINPLSGCLPILLQIPVFFALYKVLVVTIDMRHTPFFGWIRDLSAPDPTAIGNLFGLLGGLFTAEQVKAIPILGFLLGIGVLPVLYGFTMWGVQSLSPPPPDEMQRKIFALMPLIFVFLFAGFAAGLVIYWLWSNILTLAQQYVIMRRQGVETEFDKFLAKRFPKGGGTGKA